MNTISLTALRTLVTAEYALLLRMEATSVSDHLRLTQYGRVQMLQELIIGIEAADRQEAAANAL